MTEIIEADLADPSHAEAMVELLNIYALDPMGGGKELPANVRKNLAFTLRARADVRVILAVVDGEAVGLTTCFEGFSTFAGKPLLNIHDVVIKPAFRRRGLSKKMFEKAEEIAVQLGCCKLTLEVLEGNAAARAAYSKLGFGGYELDPEMGKAMFWQKKL